MVCLEYINFEHNTVAAELVRQTYDTPPLAFVHSYGCQQNVNDGERIKGVLVDIGYGLCDKPEDADLILFNTCAVREHAEQRVFGNVGALKGLKEKKPGLIIGLCGCMANQKHVVEKLRKSYPYVDLVFGVDGIDTLPQLIAQKLQKHKRVLLDPAQRPVIVENIPIRRESEFRAWLPIMYGCDNFCTYCIVPYVRGREKSRKPGDILAEFRDLVEAGYKEITLLGQNVNSYGKGLEEQIDFSDLLNLLCTVPGDYHIRFLTVDFDKALQATGVFGGHLVQNHRSAAGGQIIVAGDIAKCAVADIIAAVIKDGAIGADVEVAVQVMGDTGGIRLFNIDNRGAGRVRIACGVGINYRRG